MKKFLRAFGTNLRDIRVSHEVSLPTLADKAGISKGTLSDIENGKSDPQASTIRKLERALELSPGLLMAGAEALIGG